MYRHCADGLNEALLRYMNADPAMQLDITASYRHCTLSLSRPSGYYLL